MDVLLIDSITQFERTEWDHLVDACDAPPFYRWSFLAAYEQSPLLAGGPAVYLAAFESVGNSRLLGAIPLYPLEDVDPLGICRQSVPTLGESRASGVVTHMWHCYDSRILVLPSETSLGAILVQSVGQAMRSAGSRWFVFANVTANGQCHREIEKHLKVVPLWDRFVLDLEEFGSLDGYLASLGGKVRRNLLRQCRRAHEAGIRIETDAAPFAGIGAIAQLCNATAAKFGNGFYYDSQRWPTFLQLVDEQLFAIRVELDGELIGVWICLHDSNVLHTWAAGIEYSKTSWSPYYLAFMGALEFAFDAEISIIEGGRGNQATKESFGMRAVPLVAGFAQ